jgi:hypothetical protein
LLHNDGRINSVRTDWNNPNPDQVDGYPDVAAARATAHSVADVSTYVEKDRRV